MKVFSYHSASLSSFLTLYICMKGPKVWYRTVREIITLERMHRAFNDGLMKYGMMKAIKKG